MLELKEIRKSYTTSSFTQTALDGVSLTLRDNEFVAILGPSGSGKTTLLNIVGGLDHYDSGDLVIDGVSTKKYKDKDWDAYRNNRVGFVFQSYNLIPHQTILANVELALTLSGVSADERKRRAKEALEKVGLAEHINKRPSQLSGGQMQRVAIARALINDPEILLADEPTGALDSKTSIQIMDLLTEIASDRLVVMVTHNPELAEKYATRIVNLSDGSITSDSNPFHPSEEDLSKVSKKKTRYTSMGLKTALSLSFNNLMTKKARTFMTAVAGSIGIIGIAGILALANGVNQYIEDVEEETLSEYPIQITSSSFDMTSMLTTNEDSDDSASSENENTTSEGNDTSTSSQTSNFIAQGSSTEAGVTKMVTSMFKSIGSNDLASLKTYLESGESGIEQNVNAIEYSYNVTPQIFNSSTENGVHQVNPDNSFSAMGLGSSSYSNSLLSTTASTNVFYEMPSDSSLYIDQYDVVAGRWPENYNECVVVLTPAGNLSDFMLYTLGIRDSSELTDMVNQFLNEEEVTVPDDIEPVSYDTLLSTTFKLVYSYQYYQYDSEYEVWVDKSDNDDYMRDLVENGEDISIVGVVKPCEGQTISMLKSGINYPATLTSHLIDVAEDAEIVKDQLDSPEVDVITGTRFDEDKESDFDMDSLFTIDTSALANAFSVDASKLTFDFDASNLDFTEAFNNITIPEMDASALPDLSSAVTIDSTKFVGAIQQLVVSYTAYCMQNGIAQDQMATQFGPWLATNEEAQAIIAEGLSGAIVVDPSINETMQSAIQSYMESAMEAVIVQISAVIEEQLTQSITQAMSNFSSNVSSAFKIDESAFANAFQFNMDADDLSELMASMMNNTERSYANNLASFGYANLDEPYEIDIYPKDFENKEVCLSILDTYNANMKDAGEDDKVITYTDIVGALMSSVTDIVNMISMVLIAFVAISLVVSSIMIGVITYISVLERKKEIGILRAIGARKKDISHVFNAETIIEGFVAGILGVGVTAIGCVFANVILAALDMPQVAQLPLNAAVILVLISVLLTYIAGVIPSRSASKKDPVEALRSE